MKKIYKINDPAYKIFRKNVSSLLRNRPNLWLEPHESGMKLGGTLAKNIGGDSASLYFEDVTAANCSIILNLFAYLEGLLEHAILKKLENSPGYSDPFKLIINEYREKIIKCSRFDELKIYFKKTCGAPLSSIDGLAFEDMKFVEQFYVIRHLLAHGSTVKTELTVYKNGLATFALLGEEYETLMKNIASRKGASQSFNCDLRSLLMASEVIDDLCECTFRIGDAIQVFSDNNSVANST